MIHKLRQILRVAAFLLPLLLLGCDGLITQLPDQSIPTASPDIAAATSGAATIPLNPTATSLAGMETPMLMCTPPACATGEFYACPTGDCPGGCGTVCVTPTPISGPLAAAPTDWENLEGWLTTLWRSGVDPAAVRAALQASGMQQGLEDWHAADLDGDLRDEWILVLYDQSMPGVPFGAPGDLWVVNDAVVFRYYAVPSSDIYEFLAPTIIAVADITGDGLPELIADAPFCGAHTCTNSYRLIGTAGGQLRDLVSPVPGPDGSTSGPVISMTYADARLEEVDGDGLPEFLVHGGTIGSAGAGIIRPRTETWGWDGAAVTLAGTTLDPATYRHHILYEANDRMAAGDLEGALVLYETSINDDALRNDGFYHSPEQTYADISTFAAFRLILIDLLQGNGERANSRLTWMSALYPDSVLTGAAARLIGEWAGPGGAGALCDQIEANLQTRDNPIGVLGDMGYGNPILGAVDVCPDLTNP